MRSVTLELTSTRKLGPNEYEICERSRKDGIPATHEVDLHVVSSYWGVLREFDASLFVCDAQLKSIKKQIREQ